MSKQKKQELVFVLICAIIAFVAVCCLSGCAHIKEKECEYFESGQIKKEKDTERYGILFSEGKEFSIIEIN